MGCCLSCCRRGAPGKSRNAEMKPTIPDDVTRALDEGFRNDTNTRARINGCLSSALEKGVADPYIFALQSVANSEALFKQVAERIVEDTKAAVQDKKYRQKFMQYIWTNCLNGILADSNGGQLFDLAVIPDDAVNASGQWAVVRAVSRLSPEAFSALQKLTKAMPGPVGTDMSNALAAARKSKDLISVDLVVQDIATDIITKIQDWWNGHISGEECVKRITENNFVKAGGLIGGVAGNLSGVWLGGALGGPVGAAAGAVAGAAMGAMGGAYVAKTLSDLLKEWLFGLPKHKALEDAYTFLGVEPSASNNEINSAYRKKSLKCHPDKGGTREDWARLQCSLAVVREARGEK